MTDRTHFKALYLYIHLLILCHNKVIRCLYHFFYDEIWVSFFYVIYENRQLSFWNEHCIGIQKQNDFCISWDMLRCTCTHDIWPTIMFRANVYVFVVDSVTVLFFLVGFFFARKFTLVTWHVSRGHMTWVVFQWKLTIYPSHYICINRGILYM